MILMRHGETLFNVVFRSRRVDPGWIDPPLTPTGRAQAQAAGLALKSAGIGEIIASPYVRALETAEIVAEILGVPVSVEPLVRERAVFACDIGSPVAELRQRWPELVFDHLDDPWWSPIEESEAALDHRSRLFRARMAARSDWRRACVISHWGFIRSFAGRALSNGEMVRVELDDPA